MMEPTSVEIRQPFSLPQTISVPSYPRLAELATQLQKLNEEALVRAGEVASLQQEKIALDYQSQSVTATSETFARLAEVRRQLARFENCQAVAATKAKRVSEELESLRREFAWRFYRRRLLNSELAEVSDGPPQMKAYGPGEKIRRPRREVLTELSECLGWLAVWSGDPDLTAEMATVQAQLTEARANQ